MDLSSEQVREYTRRLIVARMRLLGTHGFFGLLLMSMRFSLDERCPTAYTDGEKIAFNPSFLESLADPELDFVLMHEVMHAALQHCTRYNAKETEALDPDRYNIACDIVVNSNILLESQMDLFAISIAGQPLIHQTPTGEEGHKYTVEEVYLMLRSTLQQGKPTSRPYGKPNATANSAPEWQKGDRANTLDDHSHWGDIEDAEILREVWAKRFRDACEAIRIREESAGRGLLPAFAERLLDQLKKPQLDWRTLLDDFVQEEITDYSFEPPDRRFYDSTFFLPAFNEAADTVKDILFMVDTSGSISDEMLASAYSEVKGAIDQYGGKLQGWLGFFDAAIIEPVPFADKDELMAIRPAGGGGTDFQIIFEYVAERMSDNPPVSIIVLTDGYAPFPPEHVTGGIPVLWIINNEKATPPWGKIARLEA